MGGPAVTLDFSRAQPIGPAGGVTLDFSKAQPLPDASDTRNAIQKSFDANTQTAPNESLLETGLKSVVHAIGSPFVHPLQAAEGVAHMGSPYDPDNPLAKVVPGVAESYQDAGGGAHGAAYAGTKLAGETFGSMALGKAAELAPGAVAGSGIGDAASTAIAKAQTVGSKLVPSLVDGPPESLMTRAIKPGKNNVNWNADVQKAVPLMKTAEEQLGHPIQGIDDALQAANVAKKQIWQQYQGRLGPAAQQGAVIDGNQIADAMVNSIDKRTALQNPGLVARVKATADTYRHPMSLNDAEDFLQSANTDLSTYYAKNKVGQQVAENDPETVSTVAEGNALRTALYSKLDQLTGPGAAQLKQAYGSLTNIQKELYNRQLVASRQNPESLAEQLSTISGAGKIAKGVLTASPGDVLEGAQNIAVSRAIKARNTSDAMITRAFQKAQPASPFPASAAPQFAGLLDRGAIATPAPNGSPNPATQPPPFNYTTRAQRLGLLLPGQTGGPIELPYVPGMTSGERLAALMQVLRKSQPTALPAQASPIRLPPPQ